MKKKKKSSYISTNGTVLNMYTRNTHFSMAFKRQKLYFAFWYFNALVCFITLAKREIKDSRLQECPKVALPK